jgi:predicted MPP superfamily phosphohydrolase
MIKKRMIYDSNAKILLLGLLITLGFIFLDGLSLLSLPRLGISYGGIRIPLFALISLRGAILFLWLILFGGIIIGRSLLGSLVVSRSSAITQFPIWPLLGLNLLFLGLELYSSFIEPTRLTVGRLVVQVPELDQSVRIVQLSDIHVERTTRRELALPGLVDSLQPDMIVMTGDYLNESYKKNQITIQDLRDLILQLHAPLGIYAVNGNVESRAKMDNLFAGLDVHFLDNEVIRIPQFGNHFVMVGLEYNTWYYDGDILKGLMSQVKPDDFSLLLYHKPDLAYTARDLGIDLYLTGHTHGGQFRLPFYGALITDSRYDKEFEMGQYQLDNMTMYVSRGLGMAGGFAPRVRFLCPPEVVVIDLVPMELQRGQ